MTAQAGPSHDVFDQTVQLLEKAVTQPIPAGDVQLLGASLFALRQRLLDLFAPQPVGEGIFRLEHWSEIPEKQRHAYANLKALLRL